MADRPERITLSDIEALTSMKADMVGVKVEGKLEAERAKRESIFSWFDERLTRVEATLRDMKASVIFWGALPSVIAAVAAWFAYFRR